MRWSSLILNTTVALFVSGVLSMPVDTTVLESRMDESLPYDSGNARKHAAANVGAPETGQGSDAGHILSKDFHEAKLAQAGVGVSQLSTDTKHKHEDQTVPEPSGQNRGAGRKEAANVEEILSGNDATHPISKGHRNMQTDPANQALALKKAKEFADGVEGISPQPYHLALNRGFMIKEAFFDHNIAMWCRVVEN
ncbi:hypothetical protein BT96DRAFT_942119 [Gymnopus androsaceus JB14]|uniref:SCP domain-containing protein n=1 Tax=Gymnopus androsaceus JB14 TaxID=1447944 RepID=A0A6A4HDZ1_9AGAR|nr:hypothetical protein BT96DRAFT_942119 [Gymnopus androsaceus JB14]